MEPAFAEDACVADVFQATDGFVVRFVLGIGERLEVRDGFVGAGAELDQVFWRFFSEGGVGHLEAKVAAED